MGRKKKKKKYSGQRVLHLICNRCQNLFNLCGCKYDESAVWVYVNDRELEEFKRTGLVPDYKSELYKTPEDKPVKVKPTKPEYDFHI